MKQYDHKKVEKKWQKYWEKNDSHKAEDFSDKPKYYALIEFPYPSGDGLHVGHIRSNTALDVIARKRRAEGYNVLYPIGWDAFGLPTENFAIKTGTAPQIVTKKNTDTFRKQLKSLGFSFDWSREINTTDPEYYRWTQWLFLQFFKHGLAYKKKMAINWCPKDKIGLANEEVIDGKCERCGTAVEQKDKEQWMLAITKYADRLDRDLADLDFVEQIKLAQKNWIGKKEDMVDGKKVTTFNIHDWVFSRQRYWGEPIPLVHCAKCGIVPVPEKDLPLMLPKVKNYVPTDTGESPLASIDKWVNTKCPQCGGDAKRETDTMPNWAGSSWYFLRYADAQNSSAFADMEKMKYWMPVDWYNGGMEHATLHLLYSRFWNEFLFDIGLVPTSEPYKKRTAHGMILAENGEKMSKSKGNVVNPDSIIEMFGADTLRVYEMFMGPFDQAIAWNTDAIVGPRRFLEKVWKFFEKVDLKNDSKNFEDKNFLSALHQTIQKVSDHIEKMEFNTAISSMMILANEFEKQEKISRDSYEKFLQLLAPFAPHISEELWSMLKHKNSIQNEPWPKADSSLLETNTMTIVVQINGKMRASFEAKKTQAEEEIKAMALAISEIKKWIEGQEVKKIIYVKNRLVNIVI
ncbi:MAG: class I tRNA ligase family protein [Candidatus Paceibacterota bacterium]